MMQMQTSNLSMHTAKLYGTYGNIEAEMAHMARISTDQHSRGLARFFALRLAEKHWSVFDMHPLRFEICTSLAILQQLTRHWSMRFQVLSQRYSDVWVMRDVLKAWIDSEQYIATQQPSHTFLPKLLLGEEGMRQYVRETHHRVANQCYYNYRDLIAKGVSYETARNCLPVSWPTRLYASGTVRTWLTYLHTRQTEHTQAEHKMLADSIAREFAVLCPNIYAGAIKCGLLVPTPSEVAND